MVLVLGSGKGHVLWVLVGTAKWMPPLIGATWTLAVPDRRDAGHATSASRGAFTPAGSATASAVAPGQSFWVSSCSPSS
jgi:hypothetical protein